jgi:uncharacterized protein YbaR (Trm112 family)
MTGVQVIIKGCPRCKGDLTLDKDRFGFCWACIQCGRIYDLPQLRVSRVGVA